MPQQDFNELSSTIRTAMRSISFKFILAGAITALLLIPASMLKGLVAERLERRGGAVKEMNSKWGAPQSVVGPVLVLPVTTKSDGKVRRTAAKFLPETLSAEAVLEPEIRRRGIYETVVYRAKLSVKGSFKPADAQRLGLALEDLTPDGAALLAIGVSDVGGIADKVSFTAGGRQLEVLPGIAGAEFTPSGFSAKCPAELLAKGFEFSLEMSLNGSGEINIVPAGKESLIKISSTWPDPSFTGGRLPAERSVGASGFKAAWRTIDLNGGHPMEWLGSSEDSKLAGSAYGARLIVPADMYQQTERSVKYAALFIALTFVSIIFAEKICRVDAHPIQYLLIGLAMILFYALLLSISEQAGFPFAYGASSLAIVVMIGAYAKAVFGKLKPSLSIGAIVAALYGYLYILLRLDDYSLLFGSVGLFIALCSLMLLTRNVNKATQEAGAKEAPPQGAE